MLFYYDTYNNILDTIKEDHNINYLGSIHKDFKRIQHDSTRVPMSMNNTIDKYLDSSSYDELNGYHISFETLTYALTTVEKLQHLKELKPKVSWKPQDDIRKTLEATTQWAFKKAYFPSGKHHASIFL